MGNIPQHVMYHIYQCNSDCCFWATSKQSVPKLDHSVLHVHWLEDSRYIVMHSTGNGYSFNASHNKFAVHLAMIQLSVNHHCKIYTMYRCVFTLQSIIVSHTWYRVIQQQIISMQSQEWN